MSAVRIIRSLLAWSLALGWLAAGHAKSGLPPQEPSSVRAPSVWANSLGMRFVRIPAGEFLAGSPDTEAGRSANETAHRVTLTRPYWLGVTHVTVGQFADFVKSCAYRTAAEKQGWATGAWDVAGEKWSRIEGGSWKSPGFRQDASHPVVCVTWHDASAFCAWLSEKEGRNYRLPTEAEWEYAARAGTGTAYSWGGESKDGAGWLNGADRTSEDLFTLFPAFPCSDGFVHTSPAATFRPNAWGIYDMLGNALQWCGDWFGEYPSAAVENPLGPSDGKERVLRGGAFVYGPRHCRNAFRGRNSPDFQNFYVGFRVLCEVADIDRP